MHLIPRKKPRIENETPSAHVVCHDVVEWIQTSSGLDQKDELKYAIRQAFARELTPFHDLQW